MTPRENARLVLNYVSAEDPIGRACRRAAEDVVRLEAVRAAAVIVAAKSRAKGARALRRALESLT